MYNLIIGIITLLAALYIVLPFFLKKKEDGNINSIQEPLDSISEKLIALHNKKETLYSAIRDIDFDYGLGKLSKDDYEELNNKYQTQAASVLKEIDEIEQETGFGELDKELEQEILAYRDTSDENLEKEISSFRASKVVSLYCTQCGSEYSETDLYCSKCGAKLNS
ncbi:MAG: zinc ribbon domain-containing protein [Thermodesulfobacteriota bacterium]